MVFDAAGHAVLKRQRADVTDERVLGQRGCSDGGSHAYCQRRVGSSASPGGHRSETDTVRCRSVAPF